MSRKEKDVIRVTHPDNDGTWVDFHGTSSRQQEVLAHYEEIWEFIKESKPQKDGGERSPEYRDKV